MQHRNAPLTPNGRRRLVALVEEDGLTFEAAAAASNVAKSTAHTWVMRWREASEERAARPQPACEDRSSARTAARRCSSEATTTAGCEVREAHRLGAATGRLGARHPPRDVHRAPQAPRLLAAPDGATGGGAPLRVALPGQTSCTWTPSAMRASPSPATR